MRLNETDFIEIAKIVEAHINRANSYSECIYTGHFTERFKAPYKKYLLKKNKADKHD